jgi:hypothetical protein
VTWEDPSTQRLLREALPVARLHGYTAMLEMIDHCRLPDEHVTRTVYAGGTRVVINRGAVPATTDDGRVVGACDYQIDGPRS